MVAIPPFRWQRWTALVIVSWALMDLTVPGLCPTELGALESKTSLPLVLSSAEARQYTTFPTPLFATTSPASSNEQAVDDDCWCCSSHVAPATRFQSSELGILSYLDLSVLENSSTGWRPPLYLPPRS